MTRQTFVLIILLKVYLTAKVLRKSFKPWTMLMSNGYEWKRFQMDQRSRTTKSLPFYRSFYRKNFIQQVEWMCVRVHFFPLKMVCSQFSSRNCFHLYLLFRLAKRFVVFSNKPIKNRDISKESPKGINKFFISRFSILIRTLSFFVELEIEGRGR